MESFSALVVVFYVFALLEGAVLVKADASSKNPINVWDNLLDSIKFEGEGLYYEFDTADAEIVYRGQVEGRPFSWSNQETQFPLASASKLFTAFGAMLTMELKPRQFYPQKPLYEFDGWQDWHDFKVFNTTKKANLTIHHLLTHTSGIPFLLRDTKEQIREQTLFYMPGTQFGYTIGHRLMGWLLRDFWSAQPETSHIQMTTVEECFRWLIFDRLGTSTQTTFKEEWVTLFGYGGDAGDAAISSSGEDFMRLAVVALRRGRLPNGKRLISEANWNKWAVPNLLPGGKLSEDLVGWQSGPGTWQNWNYGSFKQKIMQQAGKFGWNYFGSTWHNSTEIGWCGFFSSCLHVSYRRDLAFVMMERDMADKKEAKPWIRENFDEMAKALQCKQQTCHPPEPETVFCRECDGHSCHEKPWRPGCPEMSVRGKVSWLFYEVSFNPDHHTCYVPHCDKAVAKCSRVVGKSSRSLGCQQYLGSVKSVNGKCVCKEGLCAEAGKCIESSYCRKDTGGMCRFLRCHLGWGATDCINGRCVCKRGTCERDGLCDAPWANGTCGQFTGGTCSWFGCSKSLGAICNSQGLCMCPEGVCAKDGACASSTSFAQSITQGDSGDAQETPELRLNQTIFLWVAGFAASWIVVFSLWRSRRTFRIWQQRSDDVRSLDVRLLADT